MAADLAGARVLVVGASTGIGRRVGIEAIRAGAEVVFAARSRDKLEAAAAEAGGGTVVVGDVREPADCTRILDETVAALGGIDLMVFATGVSPLMPMEETPPETFHNVFATNTIGALLLLTDAASRLAPGGIVAYLSSDSVGAAYPGMVHYAASKAALDQGVDGLRMEFPETRFLRIAVGPTAGTAIALDYDPDVTARMLPQMLRFARGTEKFMTATDLGELIVEMLAPALRHRDIEVEDIVIRPPGGPVPWGTDLALQAESNKAFTEPEAAGA
jgi:NAD(P)-dependent dehydrogenase (short-subunit alcohol dehydrogenase family)